MIWESVLQCTLSGHVIRFRAIRAGQAVIEQTRTEYLYLLEYGGA